MEALPLVGALNDEAEAFAVQCLKTRNSQCVSTTLSAIAGLGHSAAAQDIFRYLLRVDVVNMLIKGGQDLDDIREEDIPLEIQEEKLNLRGAINYKNLSFLPNEPHIKKFKLNNYLKFEKKILKQINNKKLRFFKNKKLQEKFCLNSYDVTKRIYKSLKKIK